MGDATYNHIYNGTDSTGSVTQCLRPTAKAEEDDRNAVGDLPDKARADSVSPAAADDGLDALHNAIVSNNDGSVPMVAGGTPTGTLSRFVQQVLGA